MLSINVYLRLEPKNQVANLISDFNHYLAKKGVSEHYQLKPFIDKYPLHVTLYMADYKHSTIPEIMERVYLIAKQQKPVTINSSKFVLKKNNYVMLAVENSKELQDLSDKLVHSLSSLRYKKAVIPVWALKNQARQKMFQKYGSPNVMDLYKPHISVMSPHLKMKEAAKLQKELRTLVKRFNWMHKTHVKVTVDKIAIGLADEDGQIVRRVQSSVVGG